MKLYAIYYKKYIMAVQREISFIRLVKTDDIYREVGRMVLTSMEKIHISAYTEPKLNSRELEELYAEFGYIKIDDHLWRERVG